MFDLLIKELRPKQWLKNTVIFLPAIFADQFANGLNLAKLFFGFFLLSFVAGGLYIFNDIVDREKDKEHPEKKHRPIASGALSVSVASGFAILLIIGSLVLTAYLFSPAVLAILLLYSALILAYSYYLKAIPIIDLMTIAIGFVLRIIIGAAIIAVPVSNWILVTTLFFALFLGACKRRLEVKMLEDEASNHRAVLDQYTPQFTSILLGITGTLALTSYSIYTLEESVVSRLGTDKLIYTVPFVFIFILRLIFLSVDDRFTETSDPTNIIVKDRPIYLSSIAWLILVVIVILWPK